MTHRLDRHLETLQGALDHWEGEIRDYPALHAYLFPREETWRDLLRFKLLPHLRNGGCLIVSITGGTNTGKSTILNRLVGGTVSPVRYTAAATSHPLLACPPSRLDDCMSGYLISKYRPRQLTQVEEVLDSTVPRDHFFVQVVETLSENHLYLDTPDIDSIEKDNWEVAEDIRAAGDVVIAVLTEEKYNDEKVISFYKNALAGGRLIFPLMNKARKRNDYAAAREQVADFCENIGLEDAPAFMLPYNEDIDDQPAGTIPGLSQETDLQNHLRGLDIPRIKEQVYRKTLAAMQRDMRPFLERTEALAEAVHRVLQEVEQQTEAVVNAYTPTPGEKVGVLLHEFIKKKRGFLASIPASAGAWITDIAQKAKNNLFRRASMEREEVPPEEKIYAMNRSQLLAQTRQLLEAFVDIRKQLPEVVGHAIPPQIPNQEAAIEAVLEQTLGDAERSTLFRQAMWEKLNAWWREHPRQRGLIMSLDTLLMCAPTAVGIPVSFFTGGVGVPEAITLAGYASAPLYQWILRSDLAEWWLSIMEPWLDEQRAHFHQALETHIAAPMLQDLRNVDALLHHPDLAEIKRGAERCR